MNNTAAGASPVDCDVGRLAPRLLAALSKLVELEDMRLRLRQLHEMGHGTDYADYYRLLPLAWAEAREALGPNVNRRAAAARLARPMQGVTMSDPIDAVVLKMQRDSLRDALSKVLDTNDRYAKATMSYQNARENFSDSSDERKAHERAMLAASDAEREARVLLLTLRDGA